jgi:hypothetical protein
LPVEHPDACKRGRTRNTKAGFQDPLSCILYQDQNPAGNGFFLFPLSIFHLSDRFRFARWKVMLVHHLAGMKGVISASEELKVELENSLFEANNGGTSVLTFSRLSHPGPSD